jgi:hypothetical protein
MLFARGGKTPIGDYSSTDDWNQLASTPKTPTTAGNALPAREDPATKFLAQVICVSEAVERP